MSALELFLQNCLSQRGQGEVRTHGVVKSRGRSWPLVSKHFGNPSGPALIITGGVHGLERIGAQLALSLLQSFEQRLEWDLILNEMLKKIQLVFVPLVNPVGYFETTRCNGNNVDLMRNAPLDSSEKVPFLLGGHRLSQHLPWYRGEGTETETQFLLDVVKSVLQDSECVIALDLHSGFGFQDQLWFPYAGSKRPFENLSEMFLLFELFEKNHPHHIYKIEPQSKIYMTHGDLWDYSCLNFRRPGQVIIPLTLEMGSWIWVKKNPLQFFSKTGLFNPIKEHRMNRTFRRHRPLFDFMLLSLYSNSVWTGRDLSGSVLTTTKAKEKYYGG